MGICSGCLIHEEKYEIDWAERFEKIENIVNEYKSKTSKNYDCIVPVSGAGDSFYILHIVKNILKLNPLLVSYNSQFNTAVGIKNLALLRTKFDCDMLVKTVNPESVKKISRKTLRDFGSIYWHVQAGKTAFPVQVASQYKIPLIIWGAHQGVDQVGMFSHLDEVEMTNMYRVQHDLMGIEAEDLIDKFEGISEYDVSGFVYPNDDQISSVGIRGIYLSNYFFWDSKRQHEEMLKIYNYETLIQNRTFDSYNYVDCWNYGDLHDYIKYIKFGFGKVVDNASREIRLGRLNRSKGITLVKKYNNLFPAHQNLYFNWLGIKQSSFQYIINQHRSREIWQEERSFNSKHDDPYYQFLRKSDTKTGSIFKRNIKFINTRKENLIDDQNNYILIGKGL
jgi:N-acetyl sugar amidotransferase